MALTLDEVTQLSRRTYAAAEYLARGRFYFQAIARAYYSLYVLVNYTANHSPAFHWPTWPNGGKRAALAHQAVPWSLDVLYKAAGGPPIALIGTTIPKVAAKELYVQRITADYLSAAEASQPFADRLMHNAKVLADIFEQEARRVQHNPEHVA